MKTMNKKILSISLVLAQISVNSVWAQYGRGSQDTRCFKEITQNYYEIIKSKFEFQADDAVESSPVIMKDGTVVVGSHDGNIYFLSPTGKLKAKFKTRDGAITVVESTPAIMSDGTVVVGSRDGNVYFLNPNGSLKAKFETGGSVWSSPAIMKDGTVVVGSDDGKVYFLDLAPSRVKKKQEKRIVEVPGYCPDGEEVETQKISDNQIKELNKEHESNSSLEQQKPQQQKVK